MGKSETIELLRYIQSNPVPQPARYRHDTFAEMQRAGLIREYMGGVWVLTDAGRDTLGNDAQARIAELEAQLADAREVSRVKGEELAAAIAENDEYRGAMKPIAHDTVHLIDVFGGIHLSLLAWNKYGDKDIGEAKIDDFKHLYEVYAKYQGAS